MPSMRGFANAVYIFFVVLGPLLLAFYFFPFLLGEQTKLMSSQNGLGVYASGDMKVNAMALALDVNETPPLLGLTIWCHCQNNPYNVMVTLPFRITSGNATWPWTLMPSPRNWSYNETGNAASIVYAAVSVDQSYGFFQAVFSLDRTFLESVRGVETIVLQLARPVGGTDAFNQLFSRLKVGFETVPIIDVYVDLPGSSRDIQAFPDTSTRDLLPPELAGNNTVDTIAWHLSERQTITLSFVDENVASRYDTWLVVGSIVAGADISILIGYLRKRAKSYPSEEKKAGWAEILAFLFIIVLALLERKNRHNARRG